MRLVNNTHLPDEKLKEMFDLCAKPLGINAMKVTIYDSDNHNGLWGHSLSSRKEILITTGGRKKSFPFFLERKRRVINSRDRWIKDKEIKKLMNGKSNQGMLTNTEKIPIFQCFT
jgi:hypothetical protein